MFIYAGLILTVVGKWKVFKKAGKNGWEALIPYYNTWVLCEIADIKWWFFLIIIAGSLLGGSSIGGLLGLAALVATYFVNYNKLIPVDSSESADEAQQASSPAVLEDDGKVRGADTSAFLNDDTFFDADTLKAKQENAQDSTQESGETEENKHLSMLATSV